MLPLTCSGNAKLSLADEATSAGKRNFSTFCLTAAMMRMSRRYLSVDERLASHSTRFIPLHETVIPLHETVCPLGGVTRA